MPHHFLGEGGSRASLVASWFLGEERSRKSEDAYEEERRMATFSCEILGLVAVSRIEVLTGESEDVDEDEGRSLIS